MGGGSISGMDVVIEFSSEKVTVRSVGAGCSDRVRADGSDEVRADCAGVVSYVTSPII